MDKHKSTLGALLDAALDEAAAAAVERAAGDATAERRATADAADAPERVQGAAGDGSSTSGGARCVRRPVAQPLDAYVCDGVLPESLCRRLVEQHGLKERMSGEGGRLITGAVADVYWEAVAVLREEGAVELGLMRRGAVSSTQRAADDWGRARFEINSDCSS